MTDHTAPTDDPSIDDASTRANADPGVTDDTTDRRSHVREEYGDVAAGEDGCCGSATAEADDGGVTVDPSRATALGYDDDDLAQAPDGANLGLGCGNPVAISALERGETVLDLGSGGGFDCFLAAREVGPDGRVIGVDMTPEMLERARENAAESEFDHVEFRLGEIEHLPVADASADTIISNCVVNLSPDKPRVFAEAYRVLRPGGSLSISDLVATEPLPPEVRDDPDAVVECVGDAARIEDLEAWLADAGFVDVAVTEEGEWSDELPIVSARIEARKPA
ncbi:methyltransferase domain-containing protein [Natrarchaeobius halalkaliphilus]|uniref:Arsenite methyltransferase n=1 Tax=Natrarchaeobius halalkaliphilus TaxID=1679091 RepID=A0A3N6LHP1_9EURY|nr:arsenite methyltransferase [Natrarchaeobius halalkaliphilus]RQG86115.1 methyltransferase domain-containing protein [Natrarchaeobius halalkaliphilus]